MSNFSLGTTRAKTSRSSWGRVLAVLKTQYEDKMAKWNEGWSWEKEAWRGNQKVRSWSALQGMEKIWSFMMSAMGRPWGDFEENDIVWFTVSNISLDIGEGEAEEQLACGVVAQRGRWPALGDSGVGGGEWSGWRFILKREPPRFVKGFNVLCEKKERAKDDSQVEMSAPVFLTLCLVRICRGFLINGYSLFHNFWGH